MTKVDAEVVGPEEKDFVLFLDKEGGFRGEHDASGEPSSPTREAAGPVAADEQGAINEETGEINWDCPCLQAALAPPCGEFFREAFACFVASKAEPKGADCLDKFAAMQDCFRAHPEAYMREEAGLEGREEAQEGRAGPDDEQASDTGTTAVAGEPAAPPTSRHD